MTPEERFAINLRKARKATGLTQEECAFKAGLHRTQVSLYEAGTRLPRSLVLVQLAGACGVTTNDLVEGISWKPGVYRPGEVVVREEDA